MTLLQGIDRLSYVIQHTKVLTRQIMDVQADPDDNRLEPISYLYSKTTVDGELEDHLDPFRSGV